MSAPRLKIDAHFGNFVGLSNILYSESGGRQPTQRSHGNVVGTAVVGSELFGEILKRIERVAGIKPFLVFPVAAFHLTVVTRRIRSDQLMPNAQFDGRFFKQGRKIASAVGETIGKFKAIVRLDAFYLDPMAGIPGGQPVKEICRRPGRLFRISAEKPL